jgi:hypothetical protein
MSIYTALVTTTAQAHVASMGARIVVSEATRKPREAIAASVKQFKADVATKEQEILQLRLAKLTAHAVSA